MKHKLDHNFVITDKQLAYLERMAAAHGLPDASKALRCLVSFAMAEPGRETEIFETVRCADPSSCEPGRAAGQGG